MARAFQPTLKERKRYVAYEPADHKAVMDAYTELFGTVGRAQAGIMPVDLKDGKGILRTSHDTVDRLKAALVWTGKRSLTVSGTLKKARQAL